MPHRIHIRIRVVVNLQAYEIQLIPQAPTTHTCILRVPYITYPRYVHVYYQRHNSFYLRTALYVLRKGV